MDRSTFLKALSGVLAGAKVLQSVKPAEMTGAVSADVASVIGGWPYPWIMPVRVDHLPVECDLSKTSLLYALMKLQPLRSLGCGLVVSPADKFFAEELVTGSPVPVTVTVCNLPRNIWYVYDPQRIVYNGPRLHP